MKQHHIAKLVAVMILLLFVGVIAGCTPTDDKLGTNAPIRDKPYSADLEERIQRALTNQTVIRTTRPDYLPAEMFVNLPEFPADFYDVRNLVRLGRIADFENLEEKYWMQPEFFPQFEEIAVPLLQHPPEGRWGAYGLAVFPSDSVVSINPGDSLDVYFFVKSGYLVETFQGIQFNPVYPGKADILSGVEMPDGARSVTQDKNKVEDYFDVKIDPNPFLLEPNFPLYRREGTKKVKVTLTAKEYAPQGNYVIGLDTGTVAEELEQAWLKKHLTKYASAGLTKIDRPYYQVFVHVGQAPLGAITSAGSASEDSTDSEAASAGGDEQ